MLALFFRWVSLVYHTSHFVIHATYSHNIGSPHSFDYIWNLMCHSYKKLPFTPWNSKWLHFLEDWLLSLMSTLVMGFGPQD
jgi:hypothetical protein